jgi:hypothetical protein
MVSKIIIITTIMFLITGTIVHYQQTSNEKKNDEVIESQGNTSFQLIEINDNNKNIKTYKPTNTNQNTQPQIPKNKLTQKELKNKIDNLNTTDSTGSDSQTNSQTNPQDEFTTTNTNDVTGTQAGSTDFSIE